MGPHLHDYWPFVPEWLPLNTYGLSIALGFLVGAWMTRRHARRIGISPDAVLDVVLAAIVAGLAGARLFYVVQFYGVHFRGQPLWRMFAIHQGGLVFYGGLLGALPVCLWFIKRRGLPLGASLDVLAPAVMIGLAFGRIGCFSFGCCYGVPTEGAYGVTFPPDAPAYAHTAPGPDAPPRMGCRHGVVFPPDAPPYYNPEIPPGTPLFPSQLLSSAATFALSLLLSLHFIFVRSREGETAALLLVLYPMIRFIIESLRFDTRVPAGLSVAQWISLFVAAAGVAWLVRLYRRPPTAARPAPAGAAPEEPAREGERKPLPPPKKRRKKKRGKQERPPA